MLSYWAVEGPSGSQGILAGPSSDMSWAFGMGGGGIYGQFYQGWWEDAYKIAGSSIYEIFSVDEWTKLKEGENLYEALQDTFNVAPYGAIEDFRMYGMGDWTAVKIE
jgi:hypothetical protein